MTPQQSPLSSKGACPSPAKGVQQTMKYLSFQANKDNSIHKQFSFKSYLYVQLCFKDQIAKKILLIGSIHSRNLKHQKKDLF